MPILGIVASSNYQRVAPDTGAMFPLGMVSVGSGGSSTITFSSIPSTYKHLQIRSIARTNYTGGNNDGYKVNFNSDTGNNYSWHQLGGSGASAFAQSSSSTGTIYVAYVASNAAISNNFGASVIDILDYANTSKYKTLRNLTGTDNNGNGGLTLGSGLWQNTSAISSISITQWDGTSFLQYSQFALYGIKGA